MRTPILQFLAGLLAAAVLPFTVCTHAAAPALGANEVDMLVLGSTDSEKSHALTSDHADVVKGALDEPARRLLPGGAEAWEGGKVSFTMKVDPKVQNYFTARFWGDEVDKNLLVLFCDGKQIGYRHLGDIDVLALPDDEPRYNGRFYYVTTVLPLSMTQGKNEVHLEIRSTGPIWGYGINFAQYQKPMTTATRGIYRVYTHTNGCFMPAADEKQGVAPQTGKRLAPGAEVMGQAKARVNGALAGMMKARKPINQMEVQFLAHAYFVKWSAVYEQKGAVDQVVNGVDELYKRWRKDPGELWKDSATWNPGWFGVGPAGDAVRLLGTKRVHNPDAGSEVIRRAGSNAENSGSSDSLRTGATNEDAHSQTASNPLETSLDVKIDGDKTRRAAWSEMFQASRDYLRTHRRWLTNQAMFTDVNLYLCNRAVAVIDPAHALPEEKAKDYLYQAVGLAPWLGSDVDHGSEMPLGSNFYQVTDRGLTRELGYVGGYGEVGTENAMEIYDVTREPGQEGDPKIKAQVAKMIRARGAFRYPMLDEENFPAMRLETGIGWRDAHFPGGVTYVQPTGGDQSIFHEAAATLDPFAIGFVQEMFADNQAFASIASHLKDNRFRSTVGLLAAPDDYELLQSQAANPNRLPMSAEQPDFVFSDEQDGVVAIKRGQEILYVSTYWRAGYGVNFLARVHVLTPRYQQVAVVREEVVYDPSGQVYRRPDWINFGFGKGGTHIKYPKDLHQAFAGEELPIVKMPVDVKFKPGDSNVFAGMGEFYTVRFGRYLIGMNTTTDKTFELKPPAGGKGGTDMVSVGRYVAAGSSEKVAPRSTVVLYLAE